MTSTSLTPDTKCLVEQDFPFECWTGVTDLLEMRCGCNLPLLGEASPEVIERVRFAVLKLSHGSLDELVRHIDTANTDWRDSLVAAGFGHSLLAQRIWFNEHTSLKLQHTDQCSPISAGTTANDS